MKKPRIEDFDSTAARPLASPLDHYPRIEKPHVHTEPSLPAIQGNHEQERAAPPVQPASVPDGDTMIPSNHDTMIPPHPDDLVELIRTAVKQLGREPATHRFTVEEKKALAQIIFEYKQKGIITSENEITRIAINFFIEDYRLNGEKSLLAKVLERLHK
jgi:hypothetical protein